MFTNLKNLKLDQDQTQVGSSVYILQRLSTSIKIQKEMIYEMLAEHEENDIVKYKEIEDLIDSKLETVIRNFADSLRFIIEAIQNGEQAEKLLPDLFKCMNKFSVIIDEAINKIYHT